MKELKNWLLGGGAAVLVVALVWYINITATGSAETAWKTEAVQLKLNAMIDEKLATLDVPTDTALAEQGGRIDINAAGISENDQDIALTQTQLQAVANILMRPPDSE